MGITAFIPVITSHNNYIRSDPNYIRNVGCMSFFIILSQLIQL